MFVLKWNLTYSFQLVSSLFSFNLAYFYVTFEKIEHMV